MHSQKTNIKLVFSSGTVYAGFIKLFRAPAVLDGDYLIKNQIAPTINLISEELYTNPTLLQINL